jgi:hypothetical protein
MDSKQVRAQFCSVKNPLLRRKNPKLRIIPANKATHLFTGKVTMEKNRRIPNTRKAMDNSSVNNVKREIKMGLFLPFGEVNVFRSMIALAVEQENGAQKNVCPILPMIESYCTVM